MTEENELLPLTGPTAETLANWRATDYFTRGYLTACFWTNDNGAPSGEYTATDRPELFFANLSTEALAMAKRDCEKFQAENSEALELCGRDSEQAGQDFWLTREGHGAGFWDGRCHEPHGDTLTAAAKKFGTADFYQGDNGKFYFMR